MAGGVLSVTRNNKSHLTDKVWPGASCIVQDLLEVLNALCSTENRVHMGPVFGTQWSSLSCFTIVFKLLILCAARAVLNIRSHNVNLSISSIVVRPLSLRKNLSATRLLKSERFVSLRNDGSSWCWNTWVIFISTTFPILIRCWIQLLAAIDECNCCNGYLSHSTIPSTSKWKQM